MRNSGSEIPESQIAEPCGRVSNVHISVFQKVFELNSRTIPSENKSLALAVQTLLLKLMGGVPAPIIIGTLIDKTCAVWQETESGTGSCFVYDNEKLVQAFLGFRMFTML